MEQRGAFSQGGKGDSIGRRRRNWKRAAMDRKREENRKRVLWQGEGRKPEKSAVAGRGKKTGKECCGRERKGSRKDKKRRNMWRKIKRISGLINDFTEMRRKILGDNLKGIYLHGSAAMGCFNPEKSDLDLLLVVEHPVAKEDKRKFMEAVVRLNEEAPPKGMELSVVLQENCRPFVYPTPFELHFSNMHLKWFRENPDDYVENMKGTDKDLAAHVAIINHCGIVLYGQAVSQVFGPVSKDDYVDSIWNDIKDAQETIGREPVYVILNLCRALGYVKENLILSKASGGFWGLKAVPERFRALIQKALACYESGEEMETDEETAAEYAGYMLGEIRLCLL